MAIDVGIKNLAFCCMDHTNAVFFWENCDLIGDHVVKCEALTKKGKTCNKKCSYKHFSAEMCKQEGKGEGELQELGKFVYTCKTHFPKTEKITKKNILQTKKINSFLLQDIALLVQEKIQVIYQETEQIHQLDKIVIELQPKINQKMKFISHIIYSELVRLYKDAKTQIRFVPASRKLRGIIYKKYKLKNTYTNRKKMSINYVEDYIIDHDLPLLEKFNSFNKRDDACDTFNMCLQCFN